MWLAMPTTLPAAPASAPPALVDVPEFGLRVAQGCRVTLFADSDLANDICAMTLDSLGRVLVTGPGYIKRLEDTNGDGKAEKAILFGVTKTGGMGMCFDGGDLLFYGDGALSRYRDRNSDGVADGPPEKIGTFGFGEHGAHAIRKGPDGRWYFIGGNNTGFTSKSASLTGSPIREPEAGCLVRFAPDFSGSEILAHGFRNPYDFDFTADGEVVTYDSDVEREFFLPWYTPTRLYHVAHGMHHGWRLKGHERSWMRPGCYFDGVESLLPVGRGSPTGVLCYRHNQFPERYRNGLFYLDWTFGRVWFASLAKSGSTYKATSEVFLEPMGTHGFAPTDIEVAPDGSLYVCIGGRKTRGAVFHIESVGAPPTPPPADELQAVLSAPQPFAAWSRARWEPIARRLGSRPFAAAAGADRLTVAQRCRAIEVLTEMFQGLAPETARAAAVARPPEIRARVAWSLGCYWKPGAVETLAALSGDPDPWVRRAAVETLADHAADIEGARALVIAWPLLTDADGRVRGGAVRLAAALPDASWKECETRSGTADLAHQVAVAEARLLRSPPGGPDGGMAVEAVAALEKAAEPRLQLDAMRWLTRACGDWNLSQPSVEIFTAYEWASPSKLDSSATERARRAARALLDSKDALVRFEASRLLAMLEDNDPALPGRLIDRVNATTTATEDFHLLVVLARLSAPIPSALISRVAGAVLGLDGKLEGKQQRSKQTWGLRLGELCAALLKKSPPLAEAMLADPRLIQPNHVVLVKELPESAQRHAAVRFLDAVRKDRRFAWSGPLVELLAVLPEAEVTPIFREQWTNRGLRDEILPRLAAHPSPVDRGRYMDSLESSQPQLVGLALNSLAALPRDSAPDGLARLGRLLQHLCADPKQSALRSQTLGLLWRQAGEAGQILSVMENAKDPATLKETYKPVFNWLSIKFPAAAKLMTETGDDDPEMWNRLLRSVAWDRGDVARGEAVFRDRACQSCHAAANSLGPDLSGVASRFSVEDLFAAIIYPSRDVAPAYRTETFTLRDGQSYTGMVAFNSADGVILQTGTATTFRFAEADIASREQGNLSLMPSGLLAGAKPEELADLYAYLKSLRPRTQ
jgi:putative membrane-bound dehydrogenase-like protein